MYVVVCKRCVWQYVDHALNGMDLSNRAFFFVCVICTQFWCILSSEDINSSNIGYGLLTVGNNAMALAFGQLAEKIWSLNIC